MSSKLKSILVNLAVAILTAITSVLGTITFTSCGSTWNVDTQLKLERKKPVQEEAVYMLYGAYAIKDLIDNTFGDILLARSDERCKRTFLDQVQARNKRLQEQHYPEVNLNEYQLWRIGEYEDTTAAFTSKTPYQIPLA